MNKAFLRCVAVLAMIAPAVARDNGQRADSSAHIRQRFQSLRQPDQPHMSCCGEADAFEAETFDPDH
jgi:hypothetical protein